MHKTFRLWYFPILLLIGSLILVGISLSSCGSSAISTTEQCIPPKVCPAGSNPQSRQAQSKETEGQGDTIVETPISKTALKSYVIISSSDSLDSGRIVPDGSQLSIQLIPQGRLTNGKLGKMLAFKRAVSEKDIGLENIPPGTYTMRISGIDSGGKPLNVCLSYSDNEPAPSQLLALQDGLLGVEGQSATTVQLMLCPT
jgi:hypothetical protein